MGISHLYLEVNYYMYETVLQVRLAMLNKLKESLIFYTFFLLSYILCGIAYMCLKIHFYIILYMLIVLGIKRNINDECSLY